MKDRLSDLNVHVEQTDKILAEQESVVAELTSESVRAGCFFPVLETTQSQASDRRFVPLQIGAGKDCFGEESGRVEGQHGSAGGCEHLRRTRSAATDEILRLICSSSACLLPVPPSAFVHFPFARLPLAAHRSWRISRRSRSASLRCRSRRTSGSRCRCRRRRRRTSG